MSFEPVSTPLSLGDAEEMYSCVQEAYSVGVLLSNLNDAESIDSSALSEIGNLLTRLMGQPMEAATNLISEKRESD